MDITSAYEREKLSTKFTPSLIPFWILLMHLGKKRIKIELLSRATFLACNQGRTQGFELR